MHMHRRTIIQLASFGIPVAAFLAACTPGTSVASAATEAAALANAVEAAVALYPAGTVPPSVTSALAAIQAASAAIAKSSATGSPSTASLAAQIVNGANVALPVLAQTAVAIPTYGPEIALALGAVKVLLPVVAADFGIVVAAAAEPAPAVLALPSVSVSDALARYAPK